MRILYDSKNSEYKSVFGPLRESQSCTFTIKIPSECKTKGVQLVFVNEDMSLFAEYHMRYAETKSYYDVYTRTLSLCERGLYFYKFFIETENSSFSLYKEGYDMTNMEEGDWWQLSCIPDDFKVDEKYFGKPIYQIFPDRFNKDGNCDLTNKLTPFALHTDISEPPEYRPNSQGEILNCDFYGGNLKGITSKLDYLASLGVAVIYLNPIFKAYSNHRYDTCDYKTIDEMLGNENDFKELCSKAHSLGMSIILDGVFSHTGSDSIYFDKKHRFGNGAYSFPESPYRDWYDFQQYPDKYTSWWGIETLPCVNELSESYIDYIIDAEDSVIAHWLRAGADGFRLDVADELPDVFIKKIRNKIKSIKPDALLIGEVWEDASNKVSYSVRRKYFSDGELDSVMNYPFRNALIAYINGIDDGTGLRNTVMTIAENYPSDVLHCLMNFLSTHDTERITTLFGAHPPMSRDEKAVYKMPSEIMDTAITKLKAAVMLQFLLPGMPSIYYGDEIATEGFEDPFCRTYFDWSKVNDDNAILSFYRNISCYRRFHSALLLGNVDIKLLSPGSVLLLREYNGEKVKAYFNMNDTTLEIPLDKSPDIIENASADKYKACINKYGFAVISER